MISTPTPELIAVPRGHHVECWSASDKRLVNRLFVGAPVMRAAANPTTLLAAVAVGRTSFPLHADDYELVLQGWSFNGRRAWSWSQGVDIPHQALADGSRFVVSLSSGKKAIRASDGKATTDNPRETTSVLSGLRSERGTGWVIDHSPRTKSRLIMADLEGRMRVRPECPAVAPPDRRRTSQLIRIVGRVGHRGISVTSAGDLEALPIDPSRSPRPPR